MFFESKDWFNVVHNKLRHAMNLDLIKHVFWKQRLFMQYKQIVASFLFDKTLNKLRHLNDVGFDKICFSKAKIDAT